MPSHPGSDLMADFEMHSDVDSDASESVVDSDVSDSETSNLRSPLQPYEYNPLNLSSKEIRLLRIEKIPIPEGTIAICLTIRHVQLDDTAEPFTALSYVWGNEAPTHTVDILDDNLEPHTIEVRDNLWKFLVNARLSDEDWSRAWFWIDQICIQQKCHQERCHQVEMMGEIYSAAVSTLVWPGFVPVYKYDGHPWNNAFFNAEELEIIQNSWRMNDDGTTRDLGRGLDRTKMTCSTMRVLGELTTGLLICVMISPYWNRLWVIQEIVLAHRVDVLLADKMWGLPEIALAMSAIGEHSDIFKAAWDRVEHPEGFKAALEQNEQAHIGSDIMHRQISRLCGHVELLIMAREDAGAEWSEEYGLVRHEKEPTMNGDWGTCLNKTYDFECTRPHDYIYALMGLLEKELRLPVDYNIPLKDLARGIFLKELSRTESSPEDIIFQTLDIVLFYWHHAAKLGPITLVSRRKRPLMDPEFLPGLFKHMAQKDQPAYRLVTEYSVRLALQELNIRPPEVSILTALRETEEFVQFAFTALKFLHSSGVDILGSVTQDSRERLILKVLELMIEALELEALE